MAILLQLYQFIDNKIATFSAGPATITHYIFDPPTSGLDPLLSLELIITAGSFWLQT